DGKLVAERAGSGQIQTNDTDVTIGSFLQNSARFEGIIEEVRISNTARNDDWIKTEYNNLINPEGFFLNKVTKRQSDKVTEKE
ncbi:unnamed protein product, partial [marine sediment metagenome]